MFFKRNTRLKLCVQSRKYYEEVLRTRLLYIAFVRMDKSIQSSMLPLAIFSAISGLYTLDIKTSRLRHTVTAYCCLLTVLFVTYFISFTIFAAPYSLNTFGGVTHVLEELVRTIFSTYYGVKFIVHADVTSDVLEGINYADKCLQRIGVKASHSREQILCALYTLLNIIITLLRSCFVIIKWTERRAKIYSKLLSVCHVTCNLIISNFAERLVAQCVYLLYTLKQRLTRLRRAVEVVTARRTAWTGSNATLSEADATRNDDENFAEIMKINKCLFETYESIKKFYKVYFILIVLYYVLMTSVRLFFCIENTQSSYFYYFLGWRMLLLVASVFLCVNTHYEFQAVQNLVKKFYWSNKLKRFDTCLVDTIEWSISRSQTFDCGYFDVDLNLLVTMNDFLMILLFTMLPSD